jgi:hypothetical protein
MDTPHIETTTEQVHFDVAATPSHLDAEDGLDQSVALQAACLRNALQQDEADRFHSRTRKRRPLSYFADVYAKKDGFRALRTLTQRTEINFEDSEYVTRHTDESLAWAVETHFLDLQICVGDGLGLAAMLPNVGTHHALEFRLELRHRTRRFQAKYAKLGFDPTNSMLWIGRSSSGEDAWLAWVPSELNDGDDEDVAVGSGKEDTMLQEKHYRMTVMFFATMLQRIGHRDIIVNNEYPSLTDEMEFKYATNIM